MKSTPSGIMAVFYYFLFGMMLSDAGYGLVMVLGCGIILHKFKNMEEGLRKTLTMFLYCGISTIFWGDFVSAASSVTQSPLSQRHSSTPIS